MKNSLPSASEAAHYETVFGEVSEIVEAARRSAARSVNAVMTAADWLIGRQIAELEEEGKEPGGIRQGDRRAARGRPLGTVRPGVLGP